MKRHPALLLCWSVVACLCSCASSQEVRPPVEWGFEREAIGLSLTGDPRLNLYQKSPHALVACIYQLRDPNAFNQLRNEPDGPERLLECSRFDQAVATARRVVIQPGQLLNDVLDRAEGARYIGFAAGYYLLDKERSVRLYPIPTREETKGFVNRTKLVKPGRVDIRLHLGPQEIQDVKEEPRKP